MRVSGGTRRDQPDDQVGMWYMAIDNGSVSLRFYFFTKETQTLSPLLLRLLFSSNSTPSAILSSPHIEIYGAEHRLEFG